MAAVEIKAKARVIAVDKGMLGTPIEEAEVGVWVDQNSIGITCDNKIIIMEAKLIAALIDNFGNKNGVNPWGNKPVANWLFKDTSTKISGR